MLFFKWIKRIGTLRLFPKIVKRDVTCNLLLPLFPILFFMYYIFFLLRAHTKIHTIYHNVSLNIVCLFILHVSSKDRNNIHKTENVWQ